MSFPPLSQCFSLFQKNDKNDIHHGDELVNLNPIEEKSLDEHHSLNITMAYTNDPTPQNKRKMNTMVKATDNGKFGQVS